MAMEQTNVFTPLSAVFDDPENYNDPLNDADPDLNLNNELTLDNPNLCNSRYYSESQFNALDSNLSLNFSIFHLNVRSLSSNNDSLTLFLNSLNIKFHVIALTETWLSSETCDLSFLLPEYQHFKLYRKTQKGGGVSLFVHNSLKCKVLSSLSSVNEFIECLFIEIAPCTPRGKAIVTGVIYRPPNTNVSSFVTDHLNPILSHPSLQSNTCYITGDFNINLLNHSTHTATSDFIDTMFASSYLPMINRPTRIALNSSTLIDNIYTNSAHTQISTSGIFTADISDHLPIFHISKQKSTCKHYLPEPISTHPNINTRTLNNLSRSLLTQNWTEITQSNDPQSAFTQFFQIINTKFNEQIPQRNSQYHKKTHKPWITPALLTSIKRKNKLYSIHLHRKTTYTLKRYKMYKNKLSNLLRSAEKSYYSQKLLQNQNQLKSSWRIIKEIIGHNPITKKQTEFEINGTLTTDKQTIADEFNKYFINIGPNLISKLPQNLPNPVDFMNTTRTFPSLFLSPTTIDEVQSIMHTLKPTSPGHDNITLRTLKHIFPIIAQPLTHIINLSLQNGIFPNEMKIAKITPIYKSKDPSKFTNYRPISILPIFSKFFEKIMYTRLEHHLKQHKILSPYQFGFRKNHSTSMAVIQFTEKVYDIIENRKFAIATFLDLSKAFDLVNHSFLLQKLTHYGIRGIANDWINSYLENRKQFVHYNNTQSSMLNITCGVPQGSILGPLLFILYINDMNEQTQDSTLHYTLYADDTNLLISGDNITDTTQRLNTHLSTLHQWFTSNHLFINISKTNYIIFTKKSSVARHNFEINLNNHTINRVHQAKFLGVIIDSNLNWQHHISHIKSKISKVIGILYRTRQKISTKLLISLYNALILPHLTYCITIWGKTFKKYTNEIILIQKKILRIIAHSPPIAHTAPLFARYNILHFNHLYTYHTLLLAHKLYYNNLPSIMQTALLSQQTQNYHLRNQNNIPLNFRNFTLSRIGAKYNLPRVFNNIPINMKSISSFTTFKKQIKIYLKNLPA